MQVNQQVLAEVQARGEDNVDVGELSREVMGRLNLAGARSKHLKVNKVSLAPTSAYVKSMSSCADMEAVRTTRSRRAADPDHASDLDDAIGLSSPPPPEARCALFGAAPGAPPARGMGRSGAPLSLPLTSDMSPIPDCYDTEEGEIDLAQAERMVQKAFVRNNIVLSKK